jgi:hypothetical protein
MRTLDAIRLFGLNNLSIEAEIRRVEMEHDADFGHRQRKERTSDDTYYPQFRERLREEAPQWPRIMPSSIAWKIPFGS